MFVVDRDGEKYELLAKNSADDIFAGMDVEMGQGSYAMARMTYGISREQLNVAIPAGRDVVSGAHGDVRERGVRVFAVCLEHMSES